MYFVLCHVASVAWEPLALFFFTMFNLQRPLGVRHFMRAGSTLRSFSDLQS